VGERLADQTPNAVLARLARTFGRPLNPATTPDLLYSFPNPQDLAEANLAAVGIRRELASTIRALARSVLKGDLTFEASMNREEAIARLRIVRGISRPMAEYVAMRAFSEPDAFPISTHEPTAGGDAWRPWRAYAAMYLWSDYQLRV
jgi:3-methyladenine DNA glycosylase/8-oxoguanine DNA glycosylase